MYTSYKIDHLTIEGLQAIFYPQSCIHPDEQPPYEDPMCIDPKIAYFDRIADLWDGWQDVNVLFPQLRDGLAYLDISEDETIVDLGCGTGNLTRMILERLSAEGRLFAVDASVRMLETARAKLEDARVSWIQAEASHLPFENACVHRVICFSTWPHFADAENVVKELFRILKAGGWIHIWHEASKEEINAIHEEAGGAIGMDMLQPAAGLGHLLQRCGFETTEVTDTETRYRVTARKRVEVTPDQ